MFTNPMLLTLSLLLTSIAVEGIENKVLCTSLKKAAAGLDWIMNNGARVRSARLGYAVR